MSVNLREGRTTHSLRRPRFLTIEDPGLGVQRRGRLPEDPSGSPGTVDVCRRVREVVPELEVSVEDEGRKCPGGSRVQGSGLESDVRPVQSPGPTDLVRVRHLP